MKRGNITLVGENLVMDTQMDSFIEETGIAKNTAEFATLIVEELNKTYNKASLEEKKRT